MVTYIKMHLIMATNSLLPSIHMFSFPPTRLLILFFRLVARRTYSNQGGYESTYKNLLINKDTKVICQGFTGKQVNYQFSLNVGCPFQHGMDICGEKKIAGKIMKLRVWNTNQICGWIRVLSTLNKLLSMVPRWSVVSPPRRLVKLTSVSLFSVLSVR